MSTEQWNQASHVLDYIMSQPTGKPIKESPGATAVRGEPPKPQRKPKRKAEQPPEQLRLF
jgi:hypothetical protein